MTNGEFAHILNGIKDLSPEQMQRLRRELDGKIVSAAAQQPAGIDLGTIGAKRDDAELLDQAVAHALRHREQTSAARDQDASTAHELQRQLLNAGLINEMKPPITDMTPYRDRKAVPIQGESLSETVIRERR